MRIFLTAAAWLATAAPLAAQAWDSPTFFSPRPGEDIGAYLIIPDGDGATGFAGIWRQSGNINLGVRAGLAGDDNIQVGAEFYGPVMLAGPGSSLLFSWILGLGAGFDNDETWLRVPVGLSAGVALGGPGSIAVIMPYVHPRLAIDFIAVETSDGEVTDTELNFPIDIGADAAIGESFVLRLGATFGDGQNTFGAGIAYRMPRRVVVR